ncbi:hypothetical protein BD408DRAFT_417640 [Parasitella parasitica]|nr:hypothetical protein BD408DRAFT_417640 [Parasitella parasitica]
MVKSDRLLQHLFCSLFINLKVILCKDQSICVAVLKQILQPASNVVIHHCWEMNSQSLIHHWLVVLHAEGGGAYTLLTQCMRLEDSCTYYCPMQIPYMSILVNSVRLLSGPNT